MYERREPSAEIEVGRRRVEVEHDRRLAGYLGYIDERIACLGGSQYVTAWWWSQPLGAGKAHRQGIDVPQNGMVFLEDSCRCDLRLIAQVGPPWRDT